MDTCEADEDRRLLGQICRFMIGSVAVYESPLGRRDIRSLNDWNTMLADAMSEGSDPGDCTFVVLHPSCVRAIGTEIFVSAEAIVGSACAHTLFPRYLGEGLR